MLLRNHLLLAYTLILCLAPEILMRCAACRIIKKDSRFKNHSTCWLGEQNVIHVIFILGILALIKSSRVESYILVMSMLLKFGSENQVCKTLYGCWQQCWTVGDINHHLTPVTATFNLTKQGPLLWDFTHTCVCWQLYSVECKHIWVNVFGHLFRLHAVSVCNRIWWNITNK